MKKFMIYLLTALFILSAFTAVAETTGKTLLPLPDSTMEALDDSIAAVSLEEGDAYLDEDGTMRMTLGIYSFDKFDMVDVSMLEAGDTILLCGEEISVASVEETTDGVIMINGGLDEDGIDLVTDENGVYYARFYNDSKFWYLVGYADSIVSPEFTFTDSSDLDREEPLVLYAGDFLTEDSEIDYYFSPDSTTVRFEDGIVVSMERVYTP